MTLFSTLMARSGRSRRRADGFGSSESVPWDADSFPYHTVRRSIDLASMVPDGDRGRVQPATVGKRTRARLSLSRRAIVFLCAAGGLGLVLLSLAHAARTQSSLSPERGRRNSSSAGSNRSGPSGTLRRSPGSANSGNQATIGARSSTGITHHESTVRGRRVHRSAEPLGSVRL